MTFKPGVCQGVVSLATFILLEDMVLAQRHLKAGSYLFVEAYGTYWYGEVTRSDTSWSPSPMDSCFLLEDIKAEV